MSEAPFLGSSTASRLKHPPPAVSEGQLTMLSSSDSVENNELGEDIEARGSPPPPPPPNPKSNSSPIQTSAPATINTSFPTLEVEEDRILQDSGTEAASLEISEEPAQDSSSDHSASPISFTLEDVYDEIFRKNNLPFLHVVGGVEGVAKQLNIDLENGIAGYPDCASRGRPSQQRLGLLDIFIQSLREAFNTVTIFLLLVAATLSLGFGLKEDGRHHNGWLNGASLFSSIFIIVTVRTVTKCLEKWKNERLKISWLSKRRNTLVQVVREGRMLDVGESDLEDGDIAVLRKGYNVPADGLFIRGQALEIYEGFSKLTTVDAENPVLHYGSKVINGTDARMLVTSTCMKAMWGETMIQETLESAENECKFLAQLHQWDNWVNIASIFLSILNLIVLFLRFASGKPMTAIMNAVEEILTGSKGTVRLVSTLLCLSIFGLDKGIPSIIPAAIAVWSCKILAHKGLARGNGSWLGMASVDIILSGVEELGLTQDETKIDEFYVGEELVNESSVVASNVLETLFDGIGTLFLPELQSDDCLQKLLPLASWAEARFRMKRESVIQQFRMTRILSGYNPLEHLSQVVVEKNEHDGYDLHCSGPLEDILPLCSHQYGIDGREQEIDGQKRRRLEEAHERMKAKGAQVIAYAWKRLDSLDQTSADQASNLTFVGMIGLNETNSEDVKRAVSKLREGEIRTILVSGNDVADLTRIGKKYGILIPNSEDMVITAAEFRGLSEVEKMERVEKIQIIGNCLPSDKVEFMECLRRQGHVVTFLGQRMMDVPALKHADIGIAVGTCSAQIARESCQITLWNANCLSFLVNLIGNARCLQEHIRKAFQRRLILKVSRCLIIFLAIVFFGDAPMTDLQLVWLNVAVQWCGELVLLTGPSTEAATSLLPVDSSVRVITRAMWRNIAIQTFYLTSISWALQDNVIAIPGVSGDQLKTMIYNGFFMCQAFGIFIAREPWKKNIFGGLLDENTWFWVGFFVLLICQPGFAVLDHFLGTGSCLSWKLWVVCFLPAPGSWLMDLAGKIMHDLIISCSSAFQMRSVPPEALEADTDTDLV